MVCVPRAVWVDTAVWLAILPYHALAGWPEYSSAPRFFLEILALAAVREAAQRLAVKRAASPLEALWGLLFSFAVFSILGVGVWLAGIGSAWVIVAIYAALMLTLNEPLQAGSERIVDPQWESAARQAGAGEVGLWRATGSRHLIFSVGGRRPAVVVGADFFTHEQPVREFLFFHELGHLTLGHFRRLGFYNLALYASVIVLSISAATVSDLKYLGPGHWLPLGHCLLCGLVMTWLGWFAQRAESALRLRLEAEADRYAIARTGDRAAALRFLESCALHPMESGEGAFAGRRVPVTRRLEQLRNHPA